MICNILTREDNVTADSTPARDRSDAGVRVEIDGAITTIILSKPERRNAVDGPMALALRAAFQAFEADDSQAVAVLFGEGGAFCAGADLSALEDPARAHELDPSGGGAGPMGPSRLLLSKPLIAAVAGHAVAGGLELALLADLRVAEESAIFGVFCRRWGVPLIDGGTVRLPRAIGMSRALDMILTGRPVDAREALAMGLANRVVSPGQARTAAEALAREIAAFPEACMKADRHSAYAQWDLPLDAALKQEGRLGAPIVAAEGRAGARRFVGGAGRHGQFGR
jgi:enoyl-CoA hydratase